MRYVELFWSCLYVLTLGSLFGASAIICGRSIVKAFDKYNKEES